MAGSSGGNIRVTTPRRKIPEQVQPVRCFYCNGVVRDGAGRQVLDRADQVRTVHTKHPARSGEREAPKEQDELDKELARLHASLSKADRQETTVSALASAVPPCPNCGSTNREPYETRQEHSHKEDGKGSCKRGLDCTVWLTICWNCRIAR